MKVTQPVFYRFLGVHSLLIGLFPFFIPVYLWNAGFTLAHVSLFIAVSGLAFCVTLRTWEVVAARTSLPLLMAITLFLELVLLAVNLGFSNSLGFLLIFGLANGVYNCFFWTTQRTLFLEIITNRNSGRHYGNFQIFVMIFLKSGILAGGLLLEHLGFNWVFFASAIIVFVAVIFLWSTSRVPADAAADSKDPATHVVSISRVLAFRDHYGSKLIFIIDGLFLFLESHFWTISLFLIAEQNFARLGIVVIVLAVLFGLLFFVAKNRIDSLMGKRIFQAAVLMYSASWIMRTGVSTDMETQWLFGLLLLITFFSSFFRLAFNKRFYDIAKASVAREYLIIKSYYTQGAVVAIFGTLTALSSLINNDDHALNIIYLIAGVISLAYLFYRQVDKGAVADR